MSAGYQRATEPETGGTTRRGFYAAAMGVIWGAIAATLSLPAMAYLLGPPRTKKDDVWIDAGDIGRLAPEQPVQMVFRRNHVDGWKVINEKLTAWVVKANDGSVVAYGPQCTHLGCAHHWDDGKRQFLCPCHNSLFSIDGQPLAGPAPRSLDRYETKVVGKRLLLGQLRSTGQSAEVTRRRGPLA